MASPLAEKAGSFLSENARIGLHVEGAQLLYERKNGKNTLTETSAEEAELQFWVPLASLQQLLERAQAPEAGMGSLGVAVFEHIFHGDPQKKIRFQVKAGFLGLWAQGYFSVLKAGGPEVASYLAQWGFDSLSRIKDVLRKFRG